MVNYYIYAKDYSVSTNNVDYFHKNGLKTLTQFKRDVEKIKEELLLAGEPETESKIVYLHWGSRCTEIDEKRTKEAYHNKEDGQIAERDVSVCFEKNKYMHYEKVVFHAFNRNLRDINLSVAASFLKQYCTVYRNYKIYDSIDISTEFDYDKINLLNFEAEKEQLKSYIKLKFIGKCKQDARALQEIDNLKNLRKRLFHELTMKTKQTKKLTSDLKDLSANAVNIENKKINLETKDRNEFLREFVRTEWYKKLNEPVNMEKAEIEKAISTFINYIVSETKSYSFDALKFDKKFDKSVEEEKIDNNVKFPTEQEIEFPDVILDDEKGIPVILLTEFSLIEKIIFHKTQSHQKPSPKRRSHRNRWQRNQPQKTRRSIHVTQASYSKFESAMECPLYLLDDKGIRNSIGYFYTLNVFKQFLAHNTKTDPRTRKPFHGGLVLTDTDVFDKYNDYILSATYFNGKKRVVMDVDVEEFIKVCKSGANRKDRVKAEGRVLFDS
ncbi:early 94 kDa protein [Phthorimaea operculella]|nr:early 94 kDa protein [Phthorimaea operculella]